MDFSTNGNVGSGGYKYSQLLFGGDIEVMN